MICGAQIRAARALLGWSADHLAEQVGVTRQTIQRLEHHDGVPPSRSQTLLDIQSAIEFAGVEFIGAPDDKPGVRLLRSTKSHQTLLER